MGLHNLGEGLAIDASYGQSQWVMSGLLVTGFALHNGTESFGIVGMSGNHPLALKDIILLGLLASGPTGLGTVISGYGVLPYVSVAFYTLVAGSPLSVIVSLVALSSIEEYRLQTVTDMFVGGGRMHTPVWP